MFAGILVLSLLVGWIYFKFRLREFYFAVVTLAFSELARLVVLNWNSVITGHWAFWCSTSPRCGYRASVS